MYLGVAEQYIAKFREELKASEAELCCWCEQDIQPLITLQLRVLF